MFGTLISLSYLLVRLLKSWQIAFITSLVAWASCFPIDRTSIMVFIYSLYVGLKRLDFNLGRNHLNATIFLILKLALGLKEST